TAQVSAHQVGGRREVPFAALLPLVGEDVGDGVGGLAEVGGADEVLRAVGVGHERRGGGVRGEADEPVRGVGVGGAGLAGHGAVYGGADLLGGAPGAVALDGAVSGGAAGGVDGGAGDLGVEDLLAGAREGDGAAGAGDRGEGRDRFAVEAVG